MKRYWFIVLALVTLKLATGPINKQVFFSPHDMSWEQNAADAIRIRLLWSGRWLGPYNDLTLIRGPGYPLWIALCDSLHLPVCLAEQVFYAGACALFVLALRPLKLLRVISLLIYALLLFNPMMTAAYMKVLQPEALCIPLTVVVLSCGIGFYLRPSWKWAVGLGLATGWLYITREESAWIMPAVAVLLLASWRQFKIAILAPAVGTAIVGAVCLLNYHHYGVFATSEMKARPFVAAIGALERVKPVHHKHYVLVQKEVRQRVYAVSPRFAELAPVLERENLPVDPTDHSGHCIEYGTWRGVEKEILDEEDQGKEIASVVFFYALRDAVDRTFEPLDGTESMAIYQRIADEVNQACDDGRLDAGPPHNSLAPPWRDEWLPEMVKSFGCQLWRVLSFHDRIPTVDGVMPKLYGWFIPIALAVAPCLLLSFGFRGLTVPVLAVLLALICRLGLISFLDAALFAFDKPVTEQCPLPGAGRFLVPCHALVLMIVVLAIAAQAKTRTCSPAVSNPASPQ